MQNIPTALAVVAGALAQKDGRWLMYRRPPGKRHAGLWEFPGGKVEKGEGGEAALCRELSEELGIMVDPHSLQAIARADGAAGQVDAGIVINLYRVISWSGEPQPLEGGEIGWFTPQEVIGLAKPPLDAILVAKLFAADRE